MILQGFFQADSAIFRQIQPKFLLTTLKQKQPAIGGLFIT